MSVADYLPTIQEQKLAWVRFLDGLPPTAACCYAEQSLVSMPATVMPEAEAAKINRQVVAYKEVLYIVKHLCRENISKLGESE